MAVISLNHYENGKWVPAATPKVGTIVYLNGGPQRLGRVVEVRRDGSQYLPWVVRVAWANGEATVEPAHVLNVFESLIADHEKKLAGHRERLRKFVASFGLAIALLDGAASWRKRCVLGCGLSYSEPAWGAECVARCAIGDEEVPEWHTPAAADEQKAQ